MYNIRSSCTFGSCISDLTCDFLQNEYNIQKNFALYQWRSDQFIQTVIKKNPFIIEGLENVLKPYLDPIKGSRILYVQEEQHIRLWIDSVKSSNIILIDNLMDLNIVTYSGLPMCDYKTKVQIRHKFKNNSEVPFILHERPSLEETVANNREIIKFIQTINPEISLWYLNYPYSTHLDSHPEKALKIQSLSKMMWKFVPEIRQIPSFNINAKLAKDRWHFSDSFYSAIANYIMRSESGDMIMNFPPVMNFRDFCYFVSKD